MLSRAEYDAVDALRRRVLTQYRQALVDMRARRVKKKQSLWEPGTLLRKVQSILPPPGASRVLGELRRVRGSVEDLLASEVIRRESIDVAIVELRAALELEAGLGYPLLLWLREHDADKAVDASYQLLNSLANLILTGRDYAPGLPTRRSLSEVVMNLHDFFRQVTAL